MNETLIHAEINLDAIANNTRIFVDRVGPNVKVMPAIKADGYGHGAVQVARTALESGAYGLGVSRIEEGIVLRQAGIDAPILVFGYSGADMAEAIIDYNLTVSVSQKEIAQALSANALKLGKKITVHVKIDSGMGRMGMLTGKGHPGCHECHDDAVRDVVAMAKLPGLDLEGIYTHFANSDRNDKQDAVEQLEIFNDFLSRLESEGVRFSLRHAANSAAALELPASHLDMIRPGISFYGLAPSEEVDFAKTGLKPAMELKAKIISLKTVGQGFRVSYGSTYVMGKNSVIAVVPVGYADGFSRHFSSNGEMLVHGQRAPIVGRVCMDLTMLDVGHIPDVALEDEVVIFGRQGNDSLHVDELAKRLGTINYEIVSNLNARVKRVYIS